MKKEEKVKPLTCYTIIRKKNGYFSLVKLKTSKFKVEKHFQESTQLDLFTKIDREMHALLKGLLKAENKNEDGTVSL